MAFTAKLGGPSSMAGNIALAIPPPVASNEIFTGLMSFTGAFAVRTATSQGFAGSIGFAGSLVTLKRGQPAVHVITLDERPDHVIWIEAG